MSTFLRRSAVAVAAGLLAGAACTVHKSETPALTGPSEFALSVVVTAIPDSINQDGASQSAIVVSVHDASGQPKAGVSLRADITIGGVIQDFGQLSAKTMVTGADGKASTIYTAPAAVPGAGVSSVTIFVTAIGTNYQAANPQAVAIRLSPPGVIVPVTGAPLAKFAFAPAAPNAYSPTTFDGTTSCGSTDTTGACTTTSKVVTYAWDFGDGTTATGSVVTHAFPLQQTYSVALTVTNDKGAVSATSRQNVVVAAGLLPTAKFTISPTAPNVGDTVYFDGSPSTPGAGHRIVSYQWTSGDGTVGTGIAPTYKFLKAGTFTVTLKVTDEVDQSAITSTALIVASTSTTPPTAKFTLSPSPAVIGGQVVADASTSTAGAGLSIASYEWNFGDSTPIVKCTSSSTPAQCGGGGRTVSHVYTTAGVFSVSLVVTDSNGTKASTSLGLTVGASGALVAGFTFTPASPAPSGTVTFDASGSTGAVVRYQWSWGDGTAPTFVTTATTTHAFTTAGTYTVTLTVFDAAGNSSTKAISVVVQ